VCVFHFLIDIISTIVENINAIIERLMSPVLKHSVFNVFNPINKITAKFVKRDNILNGIILNNL